MTVEQRPEISSFISTWKEKPQQQVVEELASYSLETKGIPDPYYFIEDQDGDLFSPSAQIKVKDSIIKNSRLGQLEGQAFDIISTWFRERTSGTIAWISPPYSGIYPTSKIIISEIEIAAGSKRLFNRAVVLDMNGNECLELVQGLVQYSKNHPVITDQEKLRANPLILNTQDIHWTYILGEFIDMPLVWEAIRRGDDKIAKKDAIIQALNIYPALFEVTTGLAEAKKELIDMLGAKSSSCPVLLTGTAFQIFSKSSLTIGGLSSVLEQDQYGSLQFECPKCKRTNTRLKGKLITNCQHCGTSEVAC